MAASPSRLKHALVSFKARVAFNLNRYVKKQIILQIGHGGLGDNLFLSHIPQIAKQTSDVRSVFISNHSVFRDEAYKSLIWNSNPYVDGFVDAHGIEIVGPHTHDVQGTSLDGFLLKMGFNNRISHVEAGCNLLDQYMLGLGFDDGFRFHEPKIYKRIPKRTEYENAIIYDPNFITNAGAISSDAVREFFNREGIRPNFQMRPYANVVDVPEITNRISATSLEDFCSLIVSCKALYCLTTGTATLAAALGKPCTVLYGDGVNKIYHHSRMHRYVQL